MKPFRFPLARLLELRERAEEERRAELQAAREARCAVEEELDRSARERGEILRRLADVEAREAAILRPALIWRDCYLEQRIASLTREREARLTVERDAQDALRRAVQDRKVLTHLRDRQHQEHRRTARRAEQRDVDELAQRTFRDRSDRTGTAFPARKKLPGASPPDDISRNS